MDRGGEGAKRRIVDGRTHGQSSPMTCTTTSSDLVRGCEPRALVNIARECVRDQAQPGGGSFCEICALGGVRRLR